MFDFLRKKFVRILLILSALIGIILGGVFLLRRPRIQSGKELPPAPTASPVVSALKEPIRDALIKVVACYRKIIVLLENEELLEEKQRASANLVGDILYHENHQRLTALAELLSAEMADAARVDFVQPLEKTRQFLNLFEKDGDFHDADKLAFFDLVGELMAVLQSTPGASSGKMQLQARLAEDQKALKEIQLLYDKELEKIFGRFETRGMAVTREAWDRYVAYLKTQWKREEILKEYHQSLENITSSYSKPANVQESQLGIFGSLFAPKTLLLTFDDGPNPRYTRQIMEILQKYQVKGVFFELGQSLGSVGEDLGLKTSKSSAVSRELMENGFTLANHTFSHVLIPKISDKEIAGEIENTNRLLTQVTHLAPALFRPPYGARSPKLLAALEARNMKAVLWNIDSLDWADPVPKSIANRVIREVEQEKRGIILFHDIHARTVEALPLVLETLNKRGYQFLAWNGEGFAPEVHPAENHDAVLPSSIVLYRESWAVLIGIDNYQIWPRLRYAANDAQGVRQLLIDKYHFKPDCVVTLLNEQATRQKILSLLGDYLGNPETVKREDRVLVFFAGHGVTRKLPSGRDLGYIVPVDAEVGNLQGQAISMTNFQDISEAIPAKHVFFIMDSCYSGLGLTRGGVVSPENYLKEIARRSARQMLTAGGADQQVADNGPNGHSVFTWTLLQGLEGRADLNGDGYITASELGAYVGPSVSSLSQQTPAFGSLPGSEGGEFVFELKHENEFLSEMSAQLDEEAIRLNSELDRIRREIAEKNTRNQKLRRELAQAQIAWQKMQTNPAAAPGAATPVPENSRAHNDRGMRFFKEKQYGKALEEFQAAARLDPSSALAANNAGYAYYKMEKYPEAIQWYEKAIGLDPKRAIAYANLGDVYRTLGQAIEARAAFEKYLDLQPNSKFAQDVRDKMNALR